MLNVTNNWKLCWALLLNVYCKIAECRARTSDQQTYSGKTLGVILKKL